MKHRSGSNRKQGAIKYDIKEKYIRGPSTVLYSLVEKLFVNTLHYPNNIIKEGPMGSRE